MSAAIIWALIRPFLTLRNLLILAGVGGAVFLWAVWVHRGHELASVKALAAAEAQTIRSLQQQARQAAITHDIDVKTSAALQQIQTRTTDALMKVKAYVPPQADAKCIVGVGAVRVLDAAAHDLQLPATPSGVQDAPSGVALSELVEDDVANAGSFRELIARLKAWDDWYDAEAALTNHH